MGNIAAEEDRMSEFQFEGMNFEMIALYARINWDLPGDLSGSRRALPWGRKSGGTAPGMKNVHISWYSPMSHQQNLISENSWLRHIKTGILISWILRNISQNH